MWFVIITMESWETIYVLVGLYVASISVIMYWLYATISNTKNNYPLKTELYGNRFEYGDPRCGDCAQIINENSIEICNCICHTNNNTHKKYHKPEITPI